MLRYVIAGVKPNPTDSQLETVIDTNLWSLAFVWIGESPVMKFSFQEVILLAFCGIIFNHKFFLDCAYLVHKKIQILRN